MPLFIVSCQRQVVFDPKRRDSNNLVPRTTPLAPGPEAQGEVL